MNKTPLNLDKLDDKDFQRFERELNLSKKIEKYHREQPFTDLNRTHSTATFFMREMVAKLKNNGDLRNKPIKEIRWS